jgi:hypothetical protein
VNASSTNKTVMNNIITVGGTAPRDTNKNLYPAASTALGQSAIFANAPVTATLLADVHKFASVVNLTTVYLTDGYAAVVQPGQYLRFNRNDAGHTVTAATRTVYQGNWRTKIDFSPAVDSVWISEPIEVWKDTADFTIDYHLFSGSIAVDSGADISGLVPAGVFTAYDLAADIEGNTRPYGSAVDIGPYEWQPVGMADRTAARPVCKIVVPAVWRDLAWLRELKHPAALYDAKGMLVCAKLTGGRALAGRYPADGVHFLVLAGEWGVYRVVFVGTSR